MFAIILFLVEIPSIIRVSFVKAHQNQEIKVLRVKRNIQVCVFQPGADSVSDRQTLVNVN